MVDNKPGVSRNLFRLNDCFHYMLHVLCFFHQANRQSSNNKYIKMSTPSDKVLRKYENKINLGKLLIILTTDEIRKMGEKICVLQIYLQKYTSVFILFELSLYFLQIN